MKKINDSSIILVDILHSTQQGNKPTPLVSPTLEKILFEKVLSEVGASTKICIEGINTGSTGLSPEDKRYNAAVNMFWPNYADQVAKVTFYGADSRCRVSPLEYTKVERQTADMFNFINRHVIVDPPPSTIEEALSWLRDGNRNVILGCRPDRTTKENANSIYRREKIWLKNYASLAGQFEQNGKQVLVIAGLAHILQLHIQYDWPMLWLTENDPWLTPEKVYRAGMSMTGFLDSIRKT